jgi:hypothetical protein
LAERDEREIFVGREGQERFDGAQAQRDGLGRVVPLIGHPGQPSFQVLAVEVIEAEVLTSDVLGLGEVVQEALQADPVGLNRFRRQASGLGHVGVQIIAGEPEEVRCAGMRVASHQNPTCGSRDWRCRVMSA